MCQKSINHTVCVRVCVCACVHVSVCACMCVSTLLIVIQELHLLEENICVLEKSASVKMHRMCSR